MSSRLLLMIAGATLAALAASCVVDAGCPSCSEGDGGGEEGGALADAGLSANGESDGGPGVDPPPDDNDPPPSSGEFDAGGEMEVGGEIDAGPSEAPPPDDGPIPVVLNGSFEDFARSPGCYHNLSNETFTEEMAHAAAFGERSEVDVYHDCWGTTPEGDFHVGLGARSDESDAISLELSEPLVVGRSYVLRFHAEYASYSSTVLEYGVSEDPAQFGTLIGDTGPLPDASTPYEIQLTAPVAAQHLTFRVQLDGSIGWAMLDAVTIEEAG